MQGGHMIRIVNLKTLFEKLAGELSLRLGKSYLENWNGDLLISCNDEKIMLSMCGSNVRVAAPGQTEHSIQGGDDMARLIVGSESPNEIVALSNMVLSGDALRLVEVLFPKQYPQISGADL